MNNNGDIVVAWGQSAVDGSTGIYVAENRNEKWIYPTVSSGLVNPDGGIGSLTGLELADNGDTLLSWYERDLSDPDYTKTFKSEYRKGKWDWPIYNQMLF